MKNGAPPGETHGLNLGDVNPINFANYKKRGYLVDECYSLKNKKEKEKKNKQPQKLAEASIIDSESHGDLLCVTTSNDRCAVEWILDSGCTYHMCPHKDLFSTYELLDFSVVLMGNDAQCNVVGISTVQIKSHDGIVRTLTNVHHIPDLKCDLISLGTLKSNGCRYWAKVGVLKVSKGALVLMKGVT